MSDIDSVHSEKWLLYDYGVQIQGGQNGMKMNVYEYEETIASGETYVCSFTIKEGVESPIENATLVDTFEH